MRDYFYLIPIAFGIGLSALAAFMWSLKAGQYDDLEGAAERICMKRPTRRSGQHHLRDEADPPNR